MAEIRLEELTLSPVSAAEIIEWICAQMALGDLTNLESSSAAPGPAKLARWTTADFAQSQLADSRRPFSDPAPRPYTSPDAGVPKGRIARPYPWETARSRFSASQCGSGWGKIVGAAKES